MLLNRLVWSIITISLCFLAIAPAVDPGRVGAEETLPSISTAPMDINQQTASITLSRDTALANQVLSISGSGFSGLGAGLNRCIEQSRVLINNVPVEITDLEDSGSCAGKVELTSAGTFTLTAILRHKDDGTIPDALLTAGTHAVIVTDTKGVEGRTTIEIPERILDVNPKTARPATPITVSGRNFVADNPDGSSVAVDLKYDCGGNVRRTVSAEPDSSGNFEETLRVPDACGVPSTNTIIVDTLVDGVPVVTDTATHNVPEAEITVTPNRAGVGESITLTGLGFNPFDTVVRIELGGLDLLGNREESIDQDGRINIADLTVPGLDIGTHSLVMGMESGISIATTITVVPTQSGPASCANDGAVTDAASNPGLVSDCAVLLASRDTLAGSATLNWSADLAVEDWDGVTVGGSPRRVTRLILFRKQLTGEIPAELGGLTNLQTLDLHGNRLTGEIPGELGDLINLQTLWLSVNQLTGSISAELGDLTNLEELDLSGNQLTGPIPSELGDLTSLEGLYLIENQLTGPIPSELGSLTSLEGLYLSYNQLTGPIPSELGGLTNLEALDLRRNQLTGPIPSELGNLSNLQWLYLSYNQLTGPIPSELGGLTSLEWLYLSDNQLTGPIPSELGNLSNLQWLYLSGNQLTGCVPDGLRDVQTNDFGELGLGFCEGAPPVGDPLVARYDANDNGTIEKGEVIAAINDYLFGEGDAAISKGDVIRLINLYLFG